MQMTVNSNRKNTVKKEKNGDFACKFQKKKKGKSISIKKNTVKEEMQMKIKDNYIN